MPLKTSRTLRDPIFSDIPPLKGLYVWESSWEGKPDPQDNKIKLGVQITPIEQILEEYYETNSYVFLRRLNVPEGLITPEKLVDIHEVVYDKPYDIVPLDWVGAIMRKDPEPQKTSRFWCAALVGYIYTKVGILKSSTDWSILTPNDFSLSGENLEFETNDMLENVIKKIE